jgi:hypothetical protein
MAPPPAVSLEIVRTEGNRRLRRDARCVVSEESVTPLEVANALLAWVEESLPGTPGVVVRDRNDALLVAAYGCAYRCFTSIRDLSARERDVRAAAPGAEARNHPGGPRRAATS